MAYVRPHGDRFRVEVEKNGYRASHIAKTERAAKAWGIRKEDEFERLKRGAGRTLRMAIDRYLKTISTQKRSSAWEGRRLAAFAELIGDETPLVDIDSERIGRWRDERLKTVSGSTVQREANLLRNLFTVASDEWRWIERNPFRGVRLPKHNDPRHQLWTWQEIRRVLRARAGAGPKTQEMIDAFHIALATGMRLEEVLQAPPLFDARRSVQALPRAKASGRVEFPVPRRGARLLVRPAFKVSSNEGSTLFSKLLRQLLIEDREFRDSRAFALTCLSRRVDVLTLARISRHRDLKILMNSYYRESAADIARRL